MSLLLRTLPLRHASFSLFLSATAISASNAAVSFLLPKPRSLQRRRAFCNSAAAAASADAVAVKSNPSPPSVLKWVSRTGLCGELLTLCTCNVPRVSSSAASADNADLDPSVAELPPKSFLEALVKELRTLLGLRLFNIDMIREHGSKNVFYVIDVNYFPGKLWKDARLRASVCRFLPKPGASQT
ncbi:hypothetical protein DY000_02036651 [Brassica cretica]|uniref:inositol-1,3,4-trisphosphate 5/6-kinase n=1 Tax=Brassica cretica TaxID=69181 RepID=A0ABQ7BME0_BRACR|nr:hypothetical protein DY000_02036651 [Brassica cretica]